jgi:hypothetical protein
MVRSFIMMNPDVEQANARKRKREFRIRERVALFHTQRGETIGDKGPERSDRERDQIPETTAHQRWHPEGIEE